VVLDAATDVERVRRDALSLIWRAYSRHWRRPARVRPLSFAAGVSVGGRHGRHSVMPTLE
jgi:hypothetical protein